MTVLYETDFYGWCLAQAEALKKNRREDMGLDFDHLAEEIESLGKREKRMLIRALELLFSHLLKWEYQPEYRTRSWKNRIYVQRIEIENILKDNPSLKPKLEECAEEAYKKARLFAEEETKISIEKFPKKRKFSLDWAFTAELK